LRCIKDFLIAKTVFSELNCKNLLKFNSPPSWTQPNTFSKEIQIKKAQHTLYKIKSSIFKTSLRVDSSNIATPKLIVERNNINNISLLSKQLIVGVLNEQHKIN